MKTLKTLLTILVFALVNYSNGLDQSDDAVIIEGAYNNQWMNYAIK